MSTARKASGLRHLAVGAAVAAATAASLTTAVPAEAVTTAHGCTVRPIRPVGSTSPAGVKLVSYEVLYSCAGGRSIEVQQFFMEDDAPPDPDDVTGNALTTHTFGQANARQRTVTLARPNTEAGLEEVYQKVRFRVSIGGGAFSAWTAFEPSPVRSLAN